ncbi:MAG TPA: pseudouridine synthase [Phycisphaerales bacterium]|nr:pseudouridine synthase [Phycisphaerales bacterium]
MLHEDDDVLVLEKPVGILSSLVGEQRALDDPNVFDLVKEHRRRGRRGRGRAAWIIHRLDRDVSGLMLFATSQRAFDVLKEDLRARRVARRYAAIVEGRIAAPQDVLRNALPQATIDAATDRTGALAGTIRSSLAAGRDGRMRVAGADEPGEHAITHWRVLGTGRACTMLEVRLETGRRNQIRVHMAALGHPIVGDERHGATTDPIRRIGLHAASLRFHHPATGAAMRFASPIPDSFVRLVPDAMPLDPAEPSDDAPLRGSEGRRLAEPLPTDERRGSRDAEIARALDARPGRGGPGAVHAEGAHSGSWDHVAGWYEDLLERRGSDHHEAVILPGTLRLIEPRPGLRLLDVACGEGILARRLAALGVEVTGVDASARLIRAAESAPIPGRSAVPPRYIVADARSIDVAALGGPASFDVVACVMALMNFDPIEPLLRALARLLRPEGRFVAVLLHPAFRSPGQTSWIWSETAPADAGSSPRRRDGERPRSSRSAARSPGERARRTRGGTDAPERLGRRVDAYLSPAERRIVMNPGAVAAGAKPIETTTHHRPLQTYVRLLAAEGFAIDALEEWPSLRVSQPGPRAAEENRARREIPMFLALRAVRLGGPGEGDPSQDRTRLHRRPMG